MCNLEWFFNSEEWCNSTYNNCGYVDNKLEFAEFENVVINCSAVPDSVLD
jgi:hypothetical protein